MMTTHSEANPSVRHHSLYGLALRSRLRLPLLPAIGPCAIEPRADSTEVLLRRADDGTEQNQEFHCLLEMPRARTEEKSIFRLERAEFVGASESTSTDRLSWDRLLDTRLTSGRIEIRVEPESPRREVEARLLGPVAAFWLERSGRLALHASALAVDDRAFVVMGPRGAGKSTFVAAGLAAGGQLLADDLTAIVLSEDGCPAIPAGPGVLRLVPEAAQRLGFAIPPQARLRRGKIQLRLPHRNLKARRLAALVVLDPTQTGAQRLEGIPPAQAFPLLQAQNYVGPEVASRAGFEAPRFLALSQVLAKVPVLRLTLPRDLDGLGRAVAGVIDRC